MSNDGTYNGHKNYAYWNVALWIGNDEDLYTFARQCARRYVTPKRAARAFVQAMQEQDYPKTRDGVAWSANNVQAALEDLFENDFEEGYSDE